jgi:hypothetical protein
MRFWLFLLILLAVAAVGLASCQQADNKALIEYKRTGGFAGLDDHLIIQANGQAVLTQKGKRSEFLLERTQMEQLTTALDDANFTKLDKEYLPEQSGNDLIEYWITYKKHRVHTMDTAIPQALTPVLELLNEIVIRGNQ